MNLDPGTDAYRIINASLRAVANLFPLTAPDPTEGHLVSRCIETSYTLIKVLEHYDIPAKPMPVDLNICNPAWYRNIQRGVPMSKMPDQAWSLGVNADRTMAPSNEQRLLPGSGAWDGHLIVQSGRRWMMDPNAGQFNRPGRIAMPLSWMRPYPKEKWTKDESAWELFGMGANGITPEHREYALIYVRNRPDNIGYTSGSAWGSVAAERFAEQMVDLIDRLQAGTLPDHISVQAADEEEVLVDISLIKQRWIEEKEAE